ncbi:putative PEP-binding protein [Vibrio stylophorae]|nr:putative PEP-binding protein [Vibrio stylophorae]
MAMISSQIGFEFQQASLLDGIDTLTDAGIGYLPIDQLAPLAQFHPSLWYGVDKTLEPALKEQGISWSARQSFYVAQLTDKLISVSKKAQGKPVRLLFSGESSAQLAQLQGAPVTVEANPEMGVRGVSRLQQEAARNLFNWHCEALVAAMQAGCQNLEIVVPYCRTLSEAAKINDMLAEQGLCRGRHGLRVWLMACVPANAILAEKFLQYFDGLYLDLDALTQHTLGVECAYAYQNYLFNVQSDPMLVMLSAAIKQAQMMQKPVLARGASIKDDGAMAEWLIEQGASAVVVPPEQVQALLLQPA